MRTAVFAAGLAAGIALAVQSSGAQGRGAAPAPAAPGPARAPRPAEPPHKRNPEIAWRLAPSEQLRGNART